LTASAWTAFAAGILLGLVLARLLAARRRLPRGHSGDPVAATADVTDVMRQLLAASGRRAMVPVILKLVGQRLEPEQACVFVGRPDGKLALADGFGLPETVTRGFEVQPGEGLLGHVARTRRASSAGAAAPGPAAGDPAAAAGLRLDLAVPILADDRLHGVLCVGGSRRAPAQQMAIATMLATSAAWPSSRSTSSRRSRTPRTSTG
jgi:GAF domain-containing protein